MWSRRRIARSARAIGLKLVPTSGAVDDLVRAVGLHLGRKIRLVPFPLDAEDASGMWFVRDKVDYIVYREHSSAAERTAILCHELAHILLEHAEHNEGSWIERLISVVAGNIENSMSRRFFQRYGYEEEGEGEAESLGTYLVAELTRKAERHAVGADTISDRLR